MPQAGTIDQQLLINQAEEQQAAEELRQKKQQENRGLIMRNLGAGAYKSGRKKGTDDDIGSKQSEFGRSLNLAGKLRRDKKLASELKEQREKLKNQLKSKVVQPAKMGANRLLQLYWTSLISSWGLTLVFINIHVFMHMVVPSVFCKLGEEWVPKKAMAAGGEAAKTGGRMIGWVEIFALIFLDILALIILGAVSAFVVMIMSWLGKGFWGKLWSIFEGIWDLGWGGVMDLVNLFT